MPTATVYMPAVRVPDRWSRSTRPRVGAPLCVAGLCVIAMVLTWVMAALVPATHFKDAVALYRITLLGGARLDEVANALLHLLEPLQYTLWGLALVIVALGRGRPRVALAVAIVLALAPATAEMLKPLLAHPHAWVGGSYVGPASWPSGHTTAGATLAMCAVLVAPHRLRPYVAALGAAFAAAVGFSTLLLAWHLPSDVLGGCLLAALWVSLAVAALRAADARSRDQWLGRASERAPVSASAACAPTVVPAPVPASVPTVVAAPASACEPIVAPVPASVPTVVAAPASACEPIMAPASASVPTVVAAPASACEPIMAPVRDSAPTVVSVPGAPAAGSPARSRSGTGVRPRVPQRL